MIRPFLRLLFTALSLLICGGPVLAQYEEGQKAFDAGDFAGAHSAWQKGAEQGDSRAQYSLGYLAQFGLAGGADLNAARSWYEKAGGNNNADALYALGLMYETGQAGEKNLAKAFDYYHRAAEPGPQPDAEYAIGRMLLRGRGVARDAKESLKWLKRAALHNNPAGQYMLAAAYEAGWGTPIREGEAYYWYRRAELGDPVELEEQDVAFEPKIAIAALRRRLSADEIEDWDDKLRADLAAAKKKMTPPTKKEPAAKKEAVKGALTQSAEPNAVR
jgi:hypothetical protein